jgi:hypothetical protein
MATLQKKAPKISVVIVNYKTWQTTLNLYKLLTNCQDLEIIIIDNGPDDTLKKNIENSSDKIRYFLMDKNLGYAGAINKGVSYANGQWILILNNDIEVECHKVMELLKITVNSNFLVSAPRLIDMHNNIQESIGYFDGVKEHFINFLLARPRFIDAKNLRDNTSVDLAIGGAILFNKQVINKIGNWDSEFFMYFEDIDFCLRLKKENIPILYTPNISFLHHGSLTANQDKKVKEVNYQTAKKRYILKHRGYFINILNNIFHLF